MTPGPTAGRRPSPAALLLALAVVAPGPSGAAADGPKLYWTASGGGGLQRADLDLTNVEDVAIAIFSPRALALGCDGATLYWADPFAAKLSRTDLDGSHGVDVVTSLNPDGGMALDCVGGKLYFLEGTSRIVRTNLDGSDLEILVQGLAGGSIALDVAGGKLYWAGRNGVERANLDGSGAELLIDASARGIALDPVGGKLYLAVSGGIQRAELDGSNLEADFIVTAFPSELAVDAAGGKLYWAGLLSVGEIGRANLADGSEVEVLTRAGVTIVGLALDLAASRIYWTQLSSAAGSPVVKRADLTGANVETVVASEVLNPRGVAVDGRRGKLYFTSGTQVRRADLDGSNAEVIVPHVPEPPTGLVFTEDIALDVPCQKLYFSVPLLPGGEAGRVYRADLDGSNLERLGGLATPPPPFVRRPRALAFDPTGQSLYWSHVDSDPAILHRTHVVDGSGAGMPSVDPQSIALDPVNRQLYWVSRGTSANQGSILRANLDGSGAEEVLAGLDGVYGLAIDPASGKLYWTGASGVRDSDGNTFPDAGGRLALYLGPDPGPPADDSDGDGYPDHCDADYDNDGVSGGLDFRALRRSFQATQGDPAYDPAIDCDGDGSVGMPDFVCFRRGFGRPPGTRLVAPRAAGLRR